MRDMLSILISCEKATLQDVLVARRAIDPIIAAEAASNATPAHIDKLDGALTPSPLLHMPLGPFEFSS